MRAKTMRKLAALLAATVLLAASGCAAGGGNYADSFNGVLSEASGWAGDAGNDGCYAETDGNYAPGTSDGAILPENTKIIYTADMSLETTAFESAVQALDHIVEGLGGWFESRTVDQNGSYRRLSCTVRVPAESFGALLDQAGQAAHMTYLQENQSDVSESYYDTEARLTTQRTKLARLQELLAQAQDMADIITLESAISDTELQIEYLTGSLRHYDSLIGYSTVTISLREVYRLSNDTEPAVTFSQRVAEAFSDGCRRTAECLEDLTVFLVRNWVVILVLAAAVTAAVVVVLRAEKRRKRRIADQQLPPPPSAGPKEP